VESIPAILDYGILGALVLVLLGAGLYLRAENENHREAIRYDRQRQQEWDAAQREERKKTLEVIEKVAGVVTALTVRIEQLSEEHKIITNSLNGLSKRGINDH
jgi:hypothetical protein